MIGAPVKNVTCGILVHVIVSVIYKVSEYLDTKNCSCKNRLFGKLVLACEDEVRNTTEVKSIVDKKVLYKKKIITSFTLFHK